MSAIEIQNPEGHQFIRLPHPAAHKMLRKCAITFKKYRFIIPSIDILESRVAFKHYDDFFIIMIHLFDNLRIEAENSSVAKQFFENVRQDFWHGVFPKVVKRRKGRYYIESVAD